MTNVARGDGLIIPDKIPGDDFSSDGVRDVVLTIRASSLKVGGGASSIDEAWVAMPTAFIAPDDHIVHQAMAPATESAREFSGKLDRVAVALSDFADAIEPLKATFAAIKADAITFTDEIGSDGLVWLSPAETRTYENVAAAQVGSGGTSYDTGSTVEEVVAYLQGRGETVRSVYGRVEILASWTESSEHIDRNNVLLDRVAEAYAKLSQHEADCANAINRERDDVCMAPVVGVEAWQLKQSGENTAVLPWGHRVDEDRNCGESFAWGAGNAGLSMLTGLGGLIGYDPVKNDWSPQNAGNAWTATGIGLGSLLLMVTPLGPLFAALGVPVYKDAGNNTLNMLGGIVAWDTWSKNPAEAFGTALVNVGTFFMPGAGTAGGIIKALTLGTKLEALANGIIKLEQFGSKLEGLLPPPIQNLIHPFDNVTPPGKPLDFDGDSPFDPRFDGPSDSAPSVPGPRADVPDDARPPIQLDGPDSRPETAPEASPGPKDSAPDADDQLPREGPGEAPDGSSTPKDDLASPSNPKDGPEIGSEEPDVNPGQPDSAPGTEHDGEKPDTPAAHNGSEGLTPQEFDLKEKLESDIANRTLPGYDPTGGIGWDKFFDEFLKGFDADGRPHWNWPSDPPHINGFLDGNSSPADLKSGDVLERVTFVDADGLPSDGKFAAPPGTPFGDLSLPPDRLGENTTTVWYEILKPLPDEVRVGDIAPGFGQKGGGTQYYFPGGIQEWIDRGYLKET